MGCARARYSNGSQVGISGINLIGYVNELSTVHQRKNEEGGGLVSNDMRGCGAQ